MSLTDREYMSLALTLAANGAGSVNPNPLVGAVVVKDSQIVGQGWHQSFGGPHAEIFALDEAGDAARGATLYITLEPCCHHGKTPPCTAQIINAGIRRVVVATRDPHSVNDGKGVAALRAAGIDVMEGVLQDEAQTQNEVFLKFITTGRPFVHLKLATSLDGRIATKTGDAKWISGENSRICAHQMRRKYSSILVGVGTVLSDDPSLNVRHVDGVDPRPIVLDPAGYIPLEARVLQSALEPIVVTHTMPEEKERQLLAQGAVVWRIGMAKGTLNLCALLERLGDEDIDSVMIEGGGETAAHFLNAELVDKVSFFIAPVIIGGKDAIPSVGGAGIERMSEALKLHRVTTEWCGGDLLYTGYTTE